ncbi:unnamed protein product [Toxocara canis]|uniref:C2H2-type domain-containing protein n=1 Tax=Toxocara canis TaxID=6265 RepID=A0A183UQ38_TOXCA|nr:unnamed protein product [Toxocara canis]
MNRRRQRSPSCATQAETARGGDGEAEKSKKQCGGADLRMWPCSLLRESRLASQLATCVCCDSWVALVWCCCYCSSCGLGFRPETMRHDPQHQSVKNKSSPRFCC